VNTKATTTPSDLISYQQRTAAGPDFVRAIVNGIVESSPFRRRLLLLLVLPWSESSPPPSQWADVRGIMPRGDRPRLSCPMRAYAAAAADLEEIQFSIIPPASQTQCAGTSVGRLFLVALWWNWHTVFCCLPYCEQGTYAYSSVILYDRPFRVYREATITIYVNVFCLRLRWTKSTDSHENLPHDGALLSEFH